MRLVSVNVGKAESLHYGNNELVSGIRKRCAPDAVYISVQGLQHDVICNDEHHGGPDQAVYAYSVNDYDWWSEQTGRDMPAGVFGENLTIEGLPTSINVGDRLITGTVVLEATAPRIPCSKLSAVMEDSEFATIFRNAARPGVYFRVLSEGSVDVGDTVSLVPAKSATLSIIDLFHAYYEPQLDHRVIRAMLQAPVSVRIREKLEKRLERISG